MNKGPQGKGEKHKPQIGESKGDRKSFAAEGVCRRRNAMATMTLARAISNSQIQ